jgi:hypothetical protein
MVHASRKPADIPATLRCEAAAAWLGLPAALNFFLMEQAAALDDKSAESRRFSDAGLKSSLRPGRQSGQAYT